MASNKLSPLFVTAAALLLLAAVHGPIVEARKYIGINPWCRTSDHRKLCTMMVKNATTWQDASVNAITTTLYVAQRIQTLTPMLKPEIAHLEPQSQESVMATCQEDFDGIVDDLQTALEAINAKDIGTVRTTLSAAYSSDCSDALKQFGVQCPFSKAIEILQKEVDNCLAVVQQN